jgi:hypothetical protein
MPENIKIRKLSMYLKFGTEENENLTNEEVMNDEFQFDSTIV